MPTQSWRAASSFQVPLRDAPTSVTQPRRTGRARAPGGTCPCRSPLLPLLPGPQPVASLAPQLRPPLRRRPEGQPAGVSVPRLCLFLCLTFLVSVLSDTPLPRVPPPLSPPCPPPRLFSPQTFLASSGGLYCLGGGCGNVVIPGCMSSALQRACSRLAAGAWGPLPRAAPRVGSGHRAWT